MGLSRRPARFKRPDFMETKELTQKQLNSLRAAAARVFIDEGNLEDKSSETNIVADGSTSRKEKVVGVDNGVQLLAAAVTDDEERHHPDEEVIEAQVENELDLEEVIPSTRAKRTTQRPKWLDGYVTPKSKPTKKWSLGKKDLE